MEERALEKSSPRNTRACVYEFCPLHLHALYSNHSSCLEGTYRSQIHLIDLLDQKNEELGIKEVSTTIDEAKEHVQRDYKCTPTNTLKRAKPYV